MLYFLLERARWASSALARTLYDQLHSGGAVLLHLFRNMAVCIGASVTAFFVAVLGLIGGGIYLLVK